MYAERPLERLAGVAWELETAEPHRVLPDGCTDLLWMGGRLLIAGPDTRATLTPPNGRRTVGLRFAPGVGPAVFGVAASELRDRRLALGDLWPGLEVHELEDRLAGGEDAVLVLEAAAARHAAVRQPDAGARWVAAQLALGHPVATLARRLGISERHLHRRSLAAFGYGPKTLQRIVRLQHVLGLARSGTPAAMAALDSGYADQTHLAHEVRALAGVPLSLLLST